MFLQSCCRSDLPPLMQGNGGVVAFAFGFFNVLKCCKLPWEVITGLVQFPYEEKLQHLGLLI